MPLTIDNMVRWWGTEKPTLTAICQGEDRVSFAELNEWVGRVAALFVDDGLQIGERVCISGENSIEWCVAALATLRAGGVVAGLNAKMVMAEVSYLLGDYAPHLLVEDMETAKRLSPLEQISDKEGNRVALPRRISMQSIAKLRQGIRRDVRRDVDPDAVAVIITTSGSTARPKGVMFSNRSMIEHVAAFRFEEPVDVEEPKMFIVAPFSTTGGGMLLIHSLIQGGTAYFESRFNPDQVLDVIARERVTIFCATPIFFQRMAESVRFADADVSSIKISLTGGAAVAPKLLRIWADKGVLVRQLYSQSETGGWGTNNPRRFALSHPDRCGRGGPNRDIAVIDEAGNLLGPGEQGQIIIRGPGQMLGYWNNPVATAETLVSGWLHTGDLGVIDDQGLLKFVDRMKDIIISGGLNISAAEIERVISEIPEVDEVAVIAAPDQKFGETPMAVVHVSRSISASTVIEHCEKHLSNYKVPRYVMFEDAPLPRLAAGKISKPALRERYAGTVSSLERVR